MTDTTIRKTFKSDHAFSEYGTKNNRNRLSIGVDIHTCCTNTRLRTNQIESREIERAMAGRTIVLSTTCLLYTNVFLMSLEGATNWASQPSYTCVFRTTYYILLLLQCTPKSTLVGNNDFFSCYSDFFFLSNCR